MRTLVVRFYSHSIWRRHVIAAYILVSTTSPWARAVSHGKGRWARRVQPELFVFKHLSSGRWKMYFPRVVCPPPGMPKAVQRALGVECF